jgi:3-oxoacyl-[acyl-carrier-protein] synthase II
MTAVAIVAFGAVSALGEGADAVSAGESGIAARVAIARDEELARAGLSRPFAARALPVGGDDPAAELLQRALSGCASELDAVRPSWRSERVGLVLGTSSAGMRASENLFATLACGGLVTDRVSPTYYGPVAHAARGLFVSLDPAVLVLGACASSTLAIGLAMRWLERGTCDIVLAGGFDAVTVFVAAGFEGLRAITAAPPPRPFRVERDGMALGDGAAVLALARGQGWAARSYLLGFGASSDAVHLTAPDRNGIGLARAATAALDEAGRPSVDLVSAHATATPFNDASEFRALCAVLGNDRAHAVAVHAFKAQIGHTLGAGGALELLACVDAMARGILPASAGFGTPDPQAPARLLARAEAADPTTALKLTSAFGGANAALVVGRPRVTVPRLRRAAYLHRAVHVDREPALESIAARTGLPLDRVARGDALVRLALSAVANLEEVCGPLAGAGIVVGSALSTLETNALFAARLRDRGVLAAEPRRFPYTSPNAAAGECCIAFGLTGPSFSVGGGMHAALEALACATLLVEAGDADRMVVVAVDEAGPVTRALDRCGLTSGAVAVLLAARGDASAGPLPLARVGAITLRRGYDRSCSGDDAATAPSVGGHRVLIPLVGNAPLQGRPRDVLCAFPPEVFARITLEPL